MDLGVAGTGATCSVFPDQPRWAPHVVQILEQVPRAIFVPGSAHRAGTVHTMWVNSDPEAAWEVM